MRKILSVQDALAHILSKLYQSELSMRTHFRELRSTLLSQSLAVQLEEQACGCENNLLKLERVFNYLMQEPVAGNHNAIHQLAAETLQITGSAHNRYLKDVLLIGGIQNIQAVKISNYRMAYMLAAELELDTVVDLMQQIIEQESAASRALSDLFISGFNRYRKTADV